MKNGVSTTLDVLIEAALTGEPYNQRRLGLEAQRYARRLSSAKAPDLPDDLHEDICQQALLEIFRAGADGLEQRSGKAMFRRAVVAAVRTVRASYAPPGQRTRFSKEPQLCRVAAENIGQIVEHTALVRGGMANEFGEVADVGSVADPAAAAAVQQIEDALDILKLLQGAGADVAVALRLIHQDNEPVAAAAEAVGMDRFTLNRRLKAFCKSVRLAA